MANGRSVLEELLSALREEGEFPQKVTLRLVLVSIVELYEIVKNVQERQELIDDVVQLQVKHGVNWTWMRDNALMPMVMMIASVVISTLLAARIVIEVVGP